MSNWQEWAVVVILILCLVWIANKTYKFITRTKRNESPCSSCATGCALKNSVTKEHIENESCCSSEPKNTTENFEDKK